MTEKNTGDRWKFNDQTGNHMIAEVLPGGTSCKVVYLYPGYTGSRSLGAVLDSPSWNNSAWWKLLIGQRAPKD